MALITTTTSTCFPTATFTSCYTIISTLTCATSRARTFTTTITAIRTSSITSTIAWSNKCIGCFRFYQRKTGDNCTTNHRQSRFGCLLEELTTRLEFLVLLWVRHKNLSFFCIGTPAMRVKKWRKWVRPYKGQHERHRYKKSVGVLLMSFPLLRLSHCPLY